MQVAAEGKKSAEILALARKIMASEWAMLFETLLAAVFFLLGAEVACVVVLVYIISAKLFISDDPLSAFLPFLLIGLVVLRLYDSFDTFMSLKFVMGAPAVPAVIFNFVFYRVKPRFGEMNKGYLAVTCALFLGGLFSLPLSHYLSGTSLYYMFGLGPLMYFLYAFLYNKLDPHRSSDIKVRVASTAFYAAAFTVIIIAVQYIKNLSSISSGWEFSLNALSSVGNNLSTTVLMTMPFCFYLSREKGVKGGAAFAVGVLSCVAAVLSLSRGGLLFCPATCAFLVAFALVRYKGTRLRNCAVLGGIVALGLALTLSFRHPVVKLFSEGIVPTSFKVRVALFAVAFMAALFTAGVYGLFKSRSKKMLRGAIAAAAVIAAVGLAVLVLKWDKIKVLAVELDTYRGNMLIIAAKNFKRYPFFGTGIGYRGLRGVYANKQGMFGCYHCLPVQVVGSMGLFGVAQYLYMLKTRWTVLSAAPDKDYAAIVLFSYLGLLYMSLVNPGIFCPLVYGLQLVVYFISAERSGEIPSGKEIRY